MESHPVPQNVTAFEFHLIGDMTIKQFAYLAVGLTIAYVTYIALFSTAAWLAIPIIIISAGLGIALAFLPIQDQPLDHWLGAFFHAVYSPTQMEWKLPKMKKEEAQGYLQNRLQAYLYAPAAAVPAMPSTPAPVASAPVAPIAPTPAPVQATPPAPAPAPKPSKPMFSEDLLRKLTGQETPADVPSDTTLQKTVELAKEAQAVQSQIVQTEKKMEQLKQAGAYTPEMQATVGTLQELVHKSQEISSEISGLTPHAAAPAPQPAIQKPIVPTPRPLRRTLPKLTSTPNVINGIVTDVEGNYLENVVVVIHNREGLPVRALKTNKLGQFTGSTPLPDGPYTITLEKDNLSFETVKVTLSNQVMAPLDIQAKRGDTITA